VGVWARGPDAAALLEGLGLGLYALMTDLRTVRPRSERAVSATGHDAPELVVRFLTELIQLHESDGFVARQIEARVIGAPPTAVVAALRGERFDRERHPARTEVKAVTMHQLVFDPAQGRARVIVDI
jgi:SHS2 domain-containing protein